MTSISATSNQYAYTSPRDRLQDELNSEISAGTVKSADLDPLRQALDSIDETLKSQRDSDKTAGSGPPSADQIKSKIDDLIADQVSSGKLTSDQADELKNVFTNAFKGGPGGAGGPHGHRGGHGGSPEGIGGVQDTSNSSDSDGTQSSSSSSNVQDLLASFLKQLQETMSQTQGYNANSQQSQSVSAALLIDFQT